MTSRLKETLFICLLAVLGFSLFFPFLDVLPYISEGDTGRDLYAYQMTLQGQRPYQDYYWPYGPLMPYYYALFFYLFGTKVFSVLLGRLVLNVLTGVFVYGSLRLFCRPLFAALGALWFWSFIPDYTYTFNYSGGTCLVLAIVYCLLRRIGDPAFKIDLPIGVALFLLLLVKLNIGLATVAAVFASYWMINFLQAASPGRGDFLPKFLIVPLLAAGIVYFLLLKDLPSYFIFQCLPILPGYEYKGGDFFLIEAGKALVYIFWFNFSGTLFDFDSTSLFVRPWPFRLILIVGLGSLIFFLKARVFKKPVQKSDVNERTAVFILLIFALFLSHEFILSAYDYRLRWCTPLILMAVFLVAGIAVDRRKFVRIILMVLMSAAIAWDIHGRHLYRDTLHRMPGHYLSSERGRVYVFNQPEFVQTIVNAVERIQARIPAGETFLAVPFNPIYYYLTGRQAPVPELIFFDRVHITDEQQKRVIADLERQGNKWIVLSNTAFPQGEAVGLGTFGKSNSKLLAQYWKENFVLVETIGDWNVPPGWTNNNAIAIFEKK